MPELLVVLVILAILASVAVLAFRLPPVANASAPDTVVRDARRLAVERGRPVDTSIVMDDVIHLVTLLPDGRAIADTAVPLDRLTADFTAHAP